MNEVTYISDDIGLHRVHNPSSDQVAVSLHRMCCWGFVCFLESMLTEY